MTAGSIDPASVQQSLVEIAPDDAGVAACRSDSISLRHLSADERSIVESALPRRVAEFAAGRRCAHRALVAIGADLDTLARGSRGQPIWPGGVTGSISHASGLAVAVAARKSPSLGSVGIDLERVDGLDRELWRQVLTASERARCAASRAPVAAATGVFSAKEAAFKAIFPVLEKEIEFLAAHSELDDGAGHIEFPSIGVQVAVRQRWVGDLILSLAIAATENRIEPGPTLRRADRRRSSGPLIGPRAPLR